jgi:hypothetical protein
MYNYNENYTLIYRKQDGIIHRKAEEHPQKQENHFGRIGE